MRGTLPNWVSPSSTSLVKEAGTRFLCPSLATKARESAILTLDASYYGYDPLLCKCDDGTFGSPPNCIDIPRIGDTPFAINATETSGLNWKTINKAYASITDNEFGSSRVISGMDTSWLINSTQLLMSTGAYNPTATPVLGIFINITLTPTFLASTSNALAVYEGSTDLQGTRVAFFVGSGNKSLVAQTETVTVLDVLATINFKSRASAGMHFDASFLFLYDCPIG